MNQHYEFWVSYYKELKRPDGKLTEKQVQENNARLTGHRWQPGALALPCQEESFCAQVCYPGLLAGLGNSHQSDKTEGQIQLGMTLDPVTGLPFLPGSTVKGLLRSAFLQNREYVGAVLEEQGLTLTPRQVEALELDSFGRQHPQGSYEIAAEDREGRDLFLDAYPVQPDAQQRLLGLENITPHRSKDPALDGLTAPVPLTLLKVMPGVVFQFRFRLKDSVLGKEEETVTVKAEQKRQLFQALLLDLGAGAKTNVGFGALKEFKTEEKAFRYLEQLPEKPSQEPKGGGGKKGNHAGKKDGAGSAQKKERPQSNPTPQPQTVSSVRSRAEIREGMVLEGRVKFFKETYAFVELIPPKPGRKNGVDGFLHISEIARERVEAGCIGNYIQLNQRVRVLVTRTEEENQKISVSMKRVRE